MKVLYRPRRFERNHSRWLTSVPRQTADRAAVQALKVVVHLASRSPVEPCRSWRKASPWQTRWLLATARTDGQCHAQSPPGAAPDQPGRLPSHSLSVDISRPGQVKSWPDRPRFLTCKRTACATASLWPPLNARPLSPWSDPAIQYLPTHEIVDEREDIFIDSVDPVDDEKQGQGQPGGQAEDDATNGEEPDDQAPARTISLAAEDDGDGIAAQEAPKASVEPKQLALPASVPVEPLRDRAYDLYQRMVGWD